MFDYVSTIPCESTSTPGVTFAVHKPSTERNIEFNRTQAAFRDKARELQRQITSCDRRLAEHAREWHRRNEDGYKRAKLSLASPNASETETAEASRVIAGYEAEKARQETRDQLAKYDLSALTDEDPQVTEVSAILAKLEELGDTATTYVEPSELAEERSWLRRQADLLMDEYYRPARVRWGVASISGFNIDGKPVTVESQLRSGPPDLTSELFAKVEEVASFSPDKLKKSSLPIISSGPAVGSETSSTATNAEKPSSTLPVTATSISLS